MIFREANKAGLELEPGSVWLQISRLLRDMCGLGEDNLTGGTDDGPCQK